MSPDPSNSSPDTPHSPQNGSHKVLKIILIIILGIIIFAVQASFFDSGQSSAKPAHVSTTPTQYVDNRAGFKITLPAGWERVPTQDGDLADFQNAHATVIPGSQSYAPYINIIDAPAQFPSLNALVNADLSDLSQQTGHFNALSSTPETDSKQPATLLVYSFTLPGSPSLTNAQLIVVKNGNEYGVTGTALTAAWPHYGSAIKKSLLSLQM